MGYLPGDPEDKYPYIYDDEDETRRVLKRIGAGLSFGWALEYVDGFLYRFSLGSGEIGQSLDFIRVHPETGKYAKYGNDVIMNPRGLAHDGEFFFVNDRPPRKRQFRILRFFCVIFYPIHSFVVVVEACSTANILFPCSGLPGHFPGLPGQT